MQDASADAPFHDAEHERWDDLYGSEWASCHDYDPRWDYSDQLRPQWEDHPSMQHARQVLAELAAPGQARVFAADLSADDAVGVYVFGTACEPVMLLDSHAHETGTVTHADMLYQVRRTVEHEFRHAQQELDADGQPVFDEDDAENWDPARCELP